MPTLHEQMRVYQVAAQKSVLRELDENFGKGLDSAVELYESLNRVGINVDIFWVLRKTESSDRYPSYMSMVGDFASIENHSGDPLGSLSTDDHLVAIEAMRQELVRQIDFYEENITWNEVEGFFVRYHEETSSWWLQEVSEAGSLSWVIELGAE